MPRSKSIIELGDTIKVPGRGKHGTGKVIGIHPVTGSDSVLVEYRCDFNRGIHTAGLGDCRLVKKARTTT